ncbi:helix-turn-helix domain-containing protein [Sphingomonas jatrophae]|uniref:Transcriptional regulator, AraC family n=1 Tax=Sphingomonas jatrophae TaxID=1166337 RepID=A0A1I6M7E1_9SPHN|nr:helix-turn-helix domain-containing protein [Sphingomonas jatrophae]SFS11543.1 transcriptional regulator, AraC family [Sphingomonas jatrophae]
MVGSDELPTAVPNFQIESGRIGGKQALTSFAASVADVFEAKRAKGADDDDYGLAISVWHLGTVMIGSFRSSALEFERSRALTAESGLDHLLIQLYVEGGFTGTADDRDVTVRAGDIVLFDLSRTLSTAASDFWNISLLIPRQSFEGVMDTVAHFHGEVLPREAQMTGLLGDYLLSLVRRLPELNPADAILSANATVALALTVLAGHTPAGSRASNGIASPFRKAALYIDANLNDPRINAGQIASATGMSRASLYRLFEPVGGVASHIRRRRLTSAALALASPANRHRRVKDIGLERGFSSEATFSRAFSRAFGISPMAARSRAAALLATGVPTPEAEVDQDVFAGWMRTLQASS